MGTPHNWMTPPVNSWDASCIGVSLLSRHCGAHCRHPRARGKCLLSADLQNQREGKAFYGLLGQQLQAESPPPHPHPPQAERHYGGWTRSAPKVAQLTEHILVSICPGNCLPLTQLPPIKMAEWCPPPQNKVSLSGPTTITCTISTRPRGQIPSTPGPSEEDPCWPARRSPSRGRTHPDAPSPSQLPPSVNGPARVPRVKAPEPRVRTSMLLTLPSWKEQSCRLLVQMWRYLHQ